MKFPKKIISIILEHISTCYKKNKSIETIYFSKILSMGPQVQMILEVLDNEF